jgi:hypothetical protein
MPGFGFVGPAYEVDGLADTETLINGFPQQIESATGRAKARYILISRPGLQPFALIPGTVATGIQAEYTTPDGRAFVIANDSLYELTAGGATVIRGSFTLGTTGYDMTASSDQLLIVNGNDGFVLSLTTNSLIQISAAGWRGGSSCCYIEGYFICLQPNSQTFTISALKNALSWDALDFGAAQTTAGNVRRLFVDHTRLWLLATDHAEAFYNDGNSDFPWQRDQGLFMEQGIGPARSLAKADNSFFWIGNDSRGGGMVWRASGSTPGRISNHAIERAIQTYGDISNATAYSYQSNGHTFVKFHFPTAGKVWVYDCATGFWHEQLSWDPVLGYIEHLGRTHMYAFGKHLVGDWRNGHIYAVSDAYATDNGAPIRFERTAPHVTNELDWISYDRFRLDMSTTALDGDTSGLIGPYLILTISRDGGHTWGSEIQLPLATIGQYKFRVERRRLGRARDLVIRVVYTYPAKITFFNAFLQ